MPLGVTASRPALIDAVHSAYHQRRLAMFKPLLPPDQGEALRQDAITVKRRLIDPEQVDIWTSDHQTRLALRRSPLRPMPLVALARGRLEQPELVGDAIREVVRTMHMGHRGPA